MAPRREDGSPAARPRRDGAGSPLHMPSVREERDRTPRQSRSGRFSSGRGRHAEPERTSSRARRAEPARSSSRACGPQSRPTSRGGSLRGAPAARAERAARPRPAAAARPPRRSRRKDAASWASPRIQHSPLVQKRRRRRLPVVLMALVLLGLLGCGAVAVDRLLSDGRIYAGVSIGSVDVSGMTADEARAAVSAAYGAAAARGRAVIYASEEARATVDVDSELAEQAALSEQLSVEEARVEKLLWVAEAGTLGARVPVSELVEAALAVGRAGGAGERLDAARDGASIPVRLAFDEEALEALASDIDATVGEPRRDWDVAVEDGRAEVVEGHEGTIVDRAWLAGLLSEGFLGDDPEHVSFVAETAWAPLRIDEAEATRVGSAIQAVLDTGVTFAFEGASWTLSGQELGELVATEVRPEGEGYRLVPVLDGKAGRAALHGLIRDAGFTSAATVSFEVSDGEVWVATAEGSRYPHLSQALEAAREALFGAYDRTGAVVEAAPSVEIGWGEAPSRASFDEALDLGLIGEIASFTTEYNDGPGTASRRHNIHHAADRLADSVARAGGGTWSFNDVMGEANEANGFEAAHAIVGGEYEDAIGGGICQVATTVFNAVFESGFPVTERRNHSLYISSYPTGRDAAIAYPDLDLSWVNDGASDVLLRTRYTDTTLTVVLYGIDPGYVVSSETGDWVAGEPFKKRTKIDENEPAGTSYVKTKGADGRQVTVHRTVRDRSGNIVREDDFLSVYAPIDEVTVEGPHPPASEEGRPATADAEEGTAEQEGRPWDEVSAETSRQAAEEQPGGQEDTSEESDEE